MRHLLLLFSIPVFAADLPPDKGNEIPASARRPVVVKAESGKQKAEIVKHELPEGFTLSLVAAAEVARV